MIMAKWYEIWRVVENGGEVKSGYKSFAYSRWWRINEAHFNANRWTQEDAKEGHIYEVREMDATE